MKNLRAVYFGRYFNKYFALLFTPVQRRASYGVLICRPIGQEDIRTHKAIVQLGREIASQGIMAMTFDYYGAGDSPGASEDMTFGTCVDSTVEAANYFKRQCDVHNVILLGVRAGALLLGKVDTVIHPGAVVLWHPVLNGGDYVKEMKEQHKKWLLGSFVRSDGRFHQQTELQGFRYSNGFMEELTGAETDLKEFGGSQECLWVDDSRVIGRVSHSGNIKSMASKYDRFWMKNGMEDTIVPIQDIKAISGWLRHLGPNFI